MLKHVPQTKNLPARDDGLNATDQSKALAEARASNLDMANECRRIVEWYHVHFRQLYEIVGTLTIDCTAVGMLHTMSIDH